MLDVIEEKSAELEKLANAFAPLTPAEQALLRHTQRTAPLRFKPAATIPNAQQRHNAVRSLQKGYDVKARPRDDDANYSRTFARNRSLPPASADTPWVQGRTVRSELLHWLCTDSNARKYLNDFAIELEEKRVQGRLNLSHLDIPFPIICRSCWFPGGIDLDGSAVTDLVLDGSWIGPRQQSSTPSTPVFSAEGLGAKGSVLLRALHAEGEVNLIGADIRGDMSCSDGEFTGIEAALVLDRAKIGGNLHLRAKFIAKGPVRLIGTTIHGDLDCSDGKFKRSDGDELLAQRATINGSVLLQNGEYGAFPAKGRVRFDGARIGRDLDCHDAWFKGGLVLCGTEIDGQLICTGGRFIRPKGWALNAERAKIGGSMFLGFSLDELGQDHKPRDPKLGFLAVGETRLFGVSIGSSLICHAGRFRNSEGIALNTEHAKIGGSMMLRFGFHAEGEVRLFAAEVGGSVECDKAILCNPEKVALNGENASISGSMLLRFGFDAKGEVRLFGTEIGGSLECRGGTFVNAGAKLAALRLDRTTIGGAVDLSSEFRAEGKVLIESSTINRQLNLSGANLSADECTMSVRNTEIKGVLEIKLVNTSANTVVDLGNTSCAALSDDLLSWPLPGNLILDGFVYRRLEDHSAVKTRIGARIINWFRRQILRHCVPAKTNRIDDWLRRRLPAEKSGSNGLFRPQPYRQLATVLRAQGLDRDAKKILVEMARDRRKWGKEGSRLRQWLLWVTIRSGYQPIRAGLMLIVLWIFGYVVFGIGYNVHVMVPIYKDVNPVKEVNPAVAATSSAPANYEPFCAAIYAIDTSLPIISFGQR
jgi:hypothetical protein